MRVAVAAMLFAASAPAADEPAPKADDVLAQLKGKWVETSVVYSGEELLDPGRTSNLMAFDGSKFTESMPSGKPLLHGEIKVVKAGKETSELDLPHKIYAQGEIKTITVAAIVRPVGKDGLQIAYFDPELIPPGKRPDAFKSTATNGVVLITLKRQP